MNPRHRPGSSDRICVAPWVHLRLNQDGRAMPCCRSPWESEYGSLRSNTLPEIWHGRLATEFREKMLAAGAHSDCSDCYSVENAGGTSLRQQLNSRHADTLKDLLLHTDGSEAARLLRLRPALPVSLDLRLSNICNFRCRSCGPESSTSWYEDAKALDAYGGSKLTRLVDPSAPLSPDLPLLLQRATYVYFAGGEPLMDPHHAKLLQRQVDTNRTDVVLEYNTNLSLLGGEVVHLWRRFSKVLVSASLDGVGDTGALIRKGFDWKTFAANYRTLQSEVPHVELRIIWTLTSLNAHHLPEAVDDILALGDDCTPVHFSVNVANSPDCMTLSVFSDEEREELRLHYLAMAIRLHEAPLTSKTRNVSLIREFLLVARILGSANHSPEARLEFVRRMKSLDSLRGESSAAILPSLAPILGE